MMSGTCTLQVPPFRVKPCWCCTGILFMRFALYSFKAVQQVVTILNVGHFGGTGACTCLLACTWYGKMWQPVGFVSLNWILHLLLHVSLPPGLNFSHPLIIFSTY